VRRLVLRLVATFAALASVAAMPALPPASGEPAGLGRTEVPIGNWRFHLGDAPGAAEPGFDDSGWQRVRVPHTWNAGDGEDGGTYYRGTGWYRTRVHIVNSPRRLFLQFDGANLVTDVWVNGRAAGRHEGGYAAFRFDITGLAAPGTEAVVAVRVDNATNPDVAPLQGDFTMFGGLHRGVRLLATDPLHVDALDHGGPGIAVRQRTVTPDRADLAVTTRVTNDGTSARRTPVRTVVTDARNRVVAEESTSVLVPGGATVPVTQPVVVHRPRLWRGQDDPYLYRVRVSVGADAVAVPLGIRTVAMDPDRGLLLNGQPLAVRGVNTHAMRPGKGYAISDADVDADFAMIEEMGANAIRLAHYQHPQRIYDLADRHGLVLWTEIPLLGSLTASERFFSNARTQLLELIRQNQHHPSVVVWGAGNELYTNSQDANRLLSELAGTIATEDPERPSSYAFCCFNEADPMAEHTATIGHNLYFGWYYGTFADMGPWADRMHATFPDRKISVSEYGAGASLVHHGNPPRQPDPAGEFHPEEWQALYHEGNWRELRTRQFLWGTFVWVMFDFASDGRDEGDRPGLNDKGLVSADRKTRKDAFYWYQANWSREPVVHITAERDTPRFTSGTDVRIYANTAEVSLTVNGVRLGTRTPADHVATWTGVTLRPGENTLVATGGGVTHRVTWWLDGSTKSFVDTGTSGDGNASAGTAARSRGPIAGTTDDELYRTYRRGTFGYRLPVANGTYRVTLKFATPEPTGVFNVNSERQRTIAGLDVYAEAGANTALDKTFVTTVADGVLDLEFVPRVGDAVVSAISLEGTG
jgi:beta-galactosidase